jgi:thiol-disulfide isomerase/thioredoxin
MTRVVAALTLFFLCCGPIALCQASPESEALKQAQDLFEHKKYKDCLKLLKDTTKRYPNCSECYVQLSAYYLHWNATREALEAVDHAIISGSDSGSKGRDTLLPLPHVGGGRRKETFGRCRAGLSRSAARGPKIAEAHLNLGLILMRENQDELGLPEIRGYVEGWPTAHNVKYAKKVLANPRSVREPIAPDFAVMCEGGQKITSEELVGKIVVIDFWATWCPSCRAALPEMKELVRNYPSDKLVIISSSADVDQNAWRDYINKKEMTWPQFLDSNQYLTTTFNVHAFPTYIIIDGDGIIRKRIVGTDPQKSLAFQLKAELNSIFEK